ncbi:ABC transporter ATP-binding protein, partial [Candidatus Pelagibacter sp.]|nr:ABC transporter ATP-binding protein [Candidatus Pelagibacter sp.]
LDPAIEKIFINKDQTLIILIPVAIIIAFSAKGISLYFAKQLRQKENFKELWLAFHLSNLITLIL